MKTIQCENLRISLEEESLVWTIQKKNSIWKTRAEDRPLLLCEEGDFSFSDADEISHQEFQNGVGKGIKSFYQWKNGYSFETIVWAEEATEDVYFEWIPRCETGFHVKKVLWPSEMEFEEARDDWYTLLTLQQGVLLPNTWETSLGPVAFDGRFETAGGYMPWFGQVKEHAGYIMICVTPWNAGWHAEHPAKGPYTHVGVWMEPSLGRMDYRRIFRYTFLEDCDYNDLCKTYRTYVAEQGRLRTLAEKAVQNPSVDQLIGCAFVHTGIKTSVQKESDFFDPEDPEKNNHLTPFSVREQQILQLHEQGVKKLYLHLDGWAQPGYDNSHPDYLPACKEAGGWEGMQSLAETVHRCGYLFGTHDQYRDYYHNAPSYEEQYACHLPDGSVPSHNRWAGGWQSYLCATQAPYYVKRNFSELKKHGIHLDGTYLDVFTCNEGDECDSPEHRMTRRECYEYRSKCFHYLLSQGILTSSEEVSDWAIESLVFCHYAPYEFMMRPAGSQKLGIPVPLFNLVYHDCVIEPWMMEHFDDSDDYMLYALINGGAPYLIRDAAYPNCDGAFASDKEGDLLEMIQRCRIVSEFQEKVAKCELVHHELLTKDGKLQRSCFSNGMSVTADFSNGTYTFD
ncbi:MAG: DUF5696 domain-containing protein [Fusicatenibacter sp.]|nr:DUF5696 domain-containing protein [Lachnospiraceae bacterium]MDY2937502.1 DUF5696 domain-containing protein [Fusicatenibacter sp.]